MTKPQEEKKFDQTALDRQKGGLIWVYLNYSLYGYIFLFYVINYFVKIKFHKLTLGAVYLELTEMAELRTVDPSAVPEVCAC